MASASPSIRVADSQAREPPYGYDFANHSEQARSDILGDWAHEADVR